MAQLVVRNLPEAVKERLKRRAELHGRSLEAEVRDILSSVPANPPGRRAKGKEGAGTALLKKLSRHKATKADFEALDANIRELRRNWHVRDIDFGE